MSSTSLVNSQLRWGLVLMLGVIPLFLSRFWIGLATIILVYAVAAAGLALVFAHGGMLDVGHGIYFAASAYTVALAGSALPAMPLAIWILAGTAVAAAAGLAIRLILYRVGGLYLALATLALTVSAQAFLEGSDWAGKFLGVTLTGRDLFGLGNVGPNVLYIAAAVSAALALWLLTRIPKTHTGRTITAVRTARAVAEAVGVDSSWLELKVFVAGAAITGWAGGLFVVVVRIASPDLAGLSFSLELLIMNIVGGVRAALGPVYGALAIRGLPEIFQQLRDWQTLLLGVFLLIVLVGFRGGIDQVVRAVVHRTRRAVGKVKESVAPIGPTSGHPVLPPHETHTATTSEREPAGDEDVVLELRGLTKRFGGVVAADDVALVVKTGQLHALVGPNGSGKTTIIDMISGFTQPTHGEILVRGRPAEGLSPSRRSELGLARTFQLMKLSPDLTIQENIMIGAHHRSRGGLTRSFVPALVRSEEQETGEAAAATMQLLGIGSFASSYPGEAPAGIQRLTEVGRCLLSDAQVLLMDEPAAGLSEDEVRLLGRVLRDVVERGTSVLLVEHNMDLVLDIADVVTVIDAGQVIAADSPDRVAQHPDVIAAYLGRRHAEAITSAGSQGASDG